MPPQSNMPRLTQRLRERDLKALEVVIADEANGKTYLTQLQKRGLPSLKRLAHIGLGDSHQPQHCRRVLLAIYNSNAWPLNLTTLRALDDDLRRAALAVIEWSAVSNRELHEYLPNGHQLMQRFAAIEKQQEQ